MLFLLMIAVGDFVRLQIQTHIYLRIMLLSSSGNIGYQQNPDSQGHKCQHKALDLPSAVILNLIDAYFTGLYSWVRRICHYHSLQTRAVCQETQETPVRAWLPQVRTRRIPDVLQPSKRNELLTQQIRTKATRLYCVPTVRR